MEYAKGSGPIWIKGGEKYHILELAGGTDALWGWSLCNVVCDNAYLTTEDPPIEKQCKKCLKLWREMKEGRHSIKENQNNG